ncbi:hypothetical protein H6F86_30970 [Phormidium sp. FACHB-592]|uniref:Uncharacterized protein n=1 Tax=Stenomitos frigidus AS-A4 TaxID=2933935 RepID=A0ABV0KUP5_9CYAN|nr:hypothetical protein [Phormidium sp. FACHB-592]MBD2078235.1 hypothetical protein [Phormidium sp. FACHB-592]
MDWVILLKQFEDLLASTPEPPYILLVAGLLITLTCMLPLTMMIRERMKYWSENLSPDTLSSEGRLQLILPFLGTAGGVCLVLIAALEVLGLPVLPALLLSLLSTLLSGYFAWLRLGKMLSRRALRSYMEQFIDFPSVGKERFDRRPVNR